MTRSWRQSKSTDFGSSYDAPSEVAIQQGTFIDKPWFATDWTSNPSFDTQYACWTRFTTTSSIWFARRPRGGVWGAPIQISGTFTEPEGVQGCQVVVAPNSSVYVVWWQEVLNQSGQKVSSIMSRRSDDGALFGLIYNATPGGFTAASDAAATADCGTYAVKGHIRTLPLPSVDVDRSNGAVYVAFQRRPPGGSGSQIAFVRSTNGGVNWSSPIVLNDSATGDKLMPALASNPYNGHVKVFWYDRRNDPNNVSIDVYGATSTNGGASFGSNARITNGLFGVPKTFPNFDCDLSPGCGLQLANCYMGDYNQLVGFSDQGGYLHGWGDNSLKFFDPQDNLDVPDPDIRTLAGC